MGSARDSAPDPNHTSGMARSSVPMCLWSRLPSAPASASSRQSSCAILPAVDLVTPHATASGKGRPPGQQPKLPDRPGEALRSYHYTAHRPSRDTGIWCCSRPRRVGCGSLSFAWLLGWKHSETEDATSQPYELV
jgi:hypothetical protein